MLYPARQSYSGLVVVGERGGALFSLAAALEALAHHCWLLKKMQLVSVALQVLEHVCAR